MGSLNVRGPGFRCPTLNYYTCLPPKGLHAAQSRPLNAGRGRERTRGGAKGNIRAQASAASSLSSIRLLSLCLLRQLPSLHRRSGSDPVASMIFCISKGQVATGTRTVSQFCLDDCILGRSPPKENCLNAFVLFTDLIQTLKRCIAKLEDRPRPEATYGAPHQLHQRPVIVSPITGGTSQLASPVTSCSSYCSWETSRLPSLPRDLLQ